MGKNSAFSKWTTVFGFTFKQGIRTKGFLMSTIGLSIILFILVGGLNIIFALTSGDNNDESNGIKTVYTSNETNVNVVYDFFGSMFPKYKDVEFQTKTDTITELSKSIEKEANTIILNITKEASGYQLNLYVPSGMTGMTEELEDFNSSMTEYFEKFKIQNAGLNEQQITALNSPVNSVVMTVKEQEKTIGEILFSMLAPMILYFMLYFMIITYGQSISKTMIAEKSSKVMELLMTSAKPYAVVTGKILAMTSIAVIQFMCWIGAGIIGFIVGDKIAISINSEYSNVIVEIVKLISSNTDGQAFSIVVIVVTVLLMIFGFFFYCVLAGMVSAGVSKPEELSSRMGIFVMPAVISFMAVYLIPIIGGYKWLQNITRYIPFTSAFQLPADLISGKVTLAESIIPFLIMAVTASIMIIITGKIYKKKIFG